MPGQKSSSPIGYIEKTRSDAGNGGPARHSGDHPARDFLDNSDRDYRELSCERIEEAQ
jgi:hypothetical protein